MTIQAAHRRRLVLEQCLDVLPGWAGLTEADVDFDPPKGFSSFTMGVRPKVEVEPPAVLYRGLGDKQNAILDFAGERAVFLALADAGIAARCLHYTSDHRIELFHQGRSLDAVDVFDRQVQRGVAEQLWRLHHVVPPSLPRRGFFELLRARWTPLARSVVIDRRAELSSRDQKLCRDLEALFDPRVARMVERCLPDEAPVFCHNDTYHGNVMRLDDGSIRLVDFEFSCLNQRVFDFANFFAETQMVHGLPDPPHFMIESPRFTHADLSTFIGFYLDNEPALAPADRASRLRRWTEDAWRCVMLSDYMYAMAALPLALEPMQTIQFIPYAHARFHRFLQRWEAEFG